MNYVKLGFLLMLFMAGPAFSQKQKITSADQLPTRTIALEGKVMDIYHNDALLDEIANTLYANLRGDLETYDIQDKATLISYYSALMLLEFRAKKYEIIPNRLEAIRNLEEREEDKLTTGLAMYAQLEALKKFPVNSAQYQEEVGKNYLKNLEAIPFEKIEQYVINSRNRYKTLNKEVTLNSIETQFQPFIDNAKGQVMEQIAGAIVNTKFMIEYNFTLADTYLKVLDTYYERNQLTAEKAEKVDIWRDREVDLKANGSSVTIAIWDTGVDTNLFSDQLWINKKEKENRKDNDKNGFVDDVHGIAFDIHNN